MESLNGRGFTPGRLLFLLALGAAGALAVRTFVFEGIYLATDSMAPTLPKDTHVMVNKFAYLTGAPRRGDVVMFPSPVERDKDLVKRVIAVGGDEIAIDRKRVVLNGEPLEEPYVQFVRSDTQLVGDTIEAIRVPDNHVFVMGDNRDVSGDSRDWAVDGQWIPFLAVERIKGRVMGVPE